MKFITHTGLARPMLRFGFALLCALLIGGLSSSAAQAQCLGGSNDGVVDLGEACDDGNTDQTDGCLDDCTLASCGDGHVQVVGSCTGNGAPCVDNSACLTGQTCENFNVDECDEGGANSDDPDATCRTDCTVGGCGDGIVDSGEECDDGNIEDGDDCTNACTSATCGDGIIWNLGAGTEECDDMNGDNTDDCLDTCAAASCGDGFVQAGEEECDDSNEVNEDDCLNNCALPTCGDGVTHDQGTGTEECDDGNEVDTDDCVACVAAECGDGFVQAGTEECDDGNNASNDECTNACTNAVCGDGIAQTGVELCDDGNDVNNDACDNNCVPVDCGDSVVSGDEECDDGNGTNKDDCLNSCLLNTCGDGHIDEEGDDTEACDDGAANGTAEGNCLDDCTGVQTCGDGETNGSEECDDANLVGTDDCRNDCKINVCGDEIPNLLGASPEECDDGPSYCDTDCVNCTGSPNDGVLCASDADCNLGTCDINSFSPGALCTAADEALVCGPGGICEGISTCDPTEGDGVDGNADTSDNACRFDCTLGGCGDGFLDSFTEDCDDGNDVDTDACVACAFAECGDDAVQAGVEDCEDGNNTNKDDCLNSCLFNTCGDGHVDEEGPVEEQEECDEGNNNSDDPDATCRTDCTLQRCGDGVVDSGEQCDEGAANSDTTPDACRTDCKNPKCRDGVVDPGNDEVCDDDNNDDFDACDNDCKLTTCGDGIVQAGEDCDDGNQANNDGCDDDTSNGGNCTVTGCGNGVVTGVEECDNGVANSLSGDCLLNCTLNVCGDGFHNTDGSSPEACDDGGANSDVTPNACRSTCVLPSCPDGVVDDLDGEVCDDGNTDDTDNCPTTCLPAECGDGFVEDGVEECDDLNLDDNDGCDESCVAEYCGDSIPQSGLGEQCDPAGADCTVDCCSSAADQPIDTGFAGFYCQINISDQLCDYDQCKPRIVRLRDRVEKRVDRAQVVCEDERYTSCERRVLRARRAAQRAGDNAGRKCVDPVDNCVRDQFEINEEILQNLANAVVELQ